MAFTQCSLELGPIRVGGLDEPAARSLGELLVAIDPWRRLEFSAEGIARYLLRDDPALIRHALWLDDTAVGVIAIRFPWLRGPYIEMLGLGESCQGLGVGRRLLDWVEREALQAGQRQVWVAASAFNERALTFYERNGFRRIGVLEDLVKPGFNEILLGKKLAATLG